MNLHGGNPGGLGCGARPAVQDVFGRAECGVAESSRRGAAELAEEEKLPQRGLQYLNCRVEEEGRRTEEADSLTIKQTAGNDRFGQSAR